MPHLRYDRGHQGGAPGQDLQERPDLQKQAWLVLHLLLKMFMWPLELVAAAFQLVLMSLQTLALIIPENGRVATVAAAKELPRSVPELPGKEASLLHWALAWVPHTRSQLSRALVLALVACLLVIQLAVLDVQLGVRALQGLLLLLANHEAERETAKGQSMVEEEARALKVSVPAEDAVPGPATPEPAPATAATVIRAGETTGTEVEPAAAEKAEVETALLEAKEAAEEDQQPVLAHTASGPDAAAETPTTVGTAAAVSPAAEIEAAPPSKPAAKKGALPAASMAATPVKKPKHGGRGPIRGPLHKLNKEVKKLFACHK